MAIDEKDLQVVTNYVPHLRGQIEIANPILFIGAGFSLGASSINRLPLPTSTELLTAIWELCFGKTPVEDGTVLQDVFDCALRERPADLANLMINRFSVDSTTIQNFQIELLQYPWRKVYTLNVDNLVEMAAANDAIGRHVESISATTGKVKQFGSRHLPPLQVIHLNGTLEDCPDGVTFSRDQYAIRLTERDPHYVQLAAELVALPAVFIGSGAEDAPLWQHIALREERKGRGMGEKRPRVYLVSPSIPKPRVAMLSKYNFVHLPATALEFHAFLNTQCSAQRESGIRKLVEQQALLSRGHQPIGSIASLVTAESKGSVVSEFLMGSEPTWADIIEGRAASRECFEAAFKKLRECISAGSTPHVVAVTGTAGSGKSTLLKWLGLHVNADTANVHWIESNSRPSIRDTIEHLGSHPDCKVLIIEAADSYGDQLAELLRRIFSMSNFPVVVFEARSSRLDSVLDVKQLGAGVRYDEISVPRLCDSDIDGILAVLKANNRLGLLRGLSNDEQVAKLRGYCDRQLLVAMFEATTGGKFHEKIYQEFKELSPVQKAVYGMVATATYFGCPLLADEVVLGLGDSSTESFGELRKLADRRVLRVYDTRYAARHRMIAEVLFHKFVEEGILGQFVKSLLRVASVKVTERTPSADRCARLLKRCISHDLFVKVVPTAEARHIYAEYEDALSWSSHYWLHRGALEVEVGDINRAENFLGQAQSIEPSNALVRTEWAFMLLRKAEGHGTVERMELYHQAKSTIEGVLASGARAKAHPYYIMGQYGLQIILSADLPQIERDEELAYLADLVAQGVQRYPQNDHLQSLVPLIRRERLMPAVRN